MNTFEETKQETTTDNFKSVFVFNAKDTEISEIADIVYADYIGENQKNIWKTTKEELDKMLVTVIAGGRGKWRNESIETFGIATQQPLTKIQIGFLIQNFLMERNMGRGKITRDQLLKSLASVKTIKTNDDPDDETYTYIFGIFLV